ncbi:hypothetical protein Dsin_007354 [Dipteronia sinensis]|uniref:Non-specific lipid-transfer protein n=1 Tax=Dipteronia sinensis TaxID=43782 RepID=A0AAE0B0F2_9ROSI|nr:hypothetical protein Dsin_007354 [Dipteronia sinensis]
MAADLKLVYCALVACMLAVAALMADAAVSCGLVVISVTPCIGYLRSTEPLKAPCCNGIKALSSAAVTTVDRQQTCRCLKKAATTASGINPTLAAGLPAMCGVNFPFNFSLSTDCNQMLQWTTTDRHYACECLKDLAKSVSGINATLAASLPGKCGVNITYTISTSNNCAQVK